MRTFSSSMKASTTFGSNWVPAQLRSAGELVELLVGKAQPPADRVCERGHLAHVVREVWLAFVQCLHQDAADLLARGYALTRSLLRVEPLVRELQRDSRVPRLVR